MHHIHIRTKKEAGYTLIEMLVVIAIIGIIIPVLFNSINTLYSTHARTLSRAMALIEATDGVKEVVRDVRAAVYAENGALPLVEIATSTLTLYSDTDYDGTVERVRYFLNGNTVQKGIIEPTATSSYPENTETIDTIVSEVANVDNSVPLFRYYTATSSEVTSSGNILNVRRVEVQFIGSSRFRSEQSEVAIRSSASIRNLKNVY